MSFAAAGIYWVVVALWAAVLSSVIFFYARNPKAFGTIRLLLLVVGIDAFRNVFENVYFGLYFGARYGFFSNDIVGVLGQPALLLVPKIINVVAGTVVLALLLYQLLPEAVREWAKSQQRTRDLEKLAAIDPLTGISNRRQFESLARAELGRSQRYMRPLSLLMIDIDHFKQVNDRFGHEAGDRVLKFLANVLISAKRASDVVGRIGGEEFAILLPETSKEAALVIAERLRQLAQTCAPAIAGEKLDVTISIGVAAASIRTSGMETLCRQADQALYEAKRSGRNRVVAAREVAEKVAMAAE
jgi:diguanylate cyclase (GGDEF)-like protein